MLVFMIRLLGSQPEVWREIAVPEDFTFWDLHVAIQESMGWDNVHLHEFVLNWKGKEIVLRTASDDILDDFEVLDEKSVKLGDWFGDRVRKAIYIYDFGDEWVHEVELMKTLEVNSNMPMILGGFGACPPEDVGGVDGYLRLLKALKDEKDEYHQLATEILGENFDPEYFDPSSVTFSNFKGRT